jgi:hypothetical protein
MRLSKFQITQPNSFRKFQLFFVILIALLTTNCQKDDSSGFGETQDNFMPDSIYKTSTDGFLYVEFVFNNHEWSPGNPIARIYSDKNIDSLKILGSVYYASTIPVKTNTYWKVINLTDNKLLIKWTPIN